MLIGPSGGMQARIPVVVAQAGGNPLVDGPGPTGHKEGGRRGLPKMRSHHGTIAPRDCGDTGYRSVSFVLSVPAA